MLNGSWLRKLELGGIGGFFASIMGLKKAGQIKIENKYTVQIKIENKYTVTFNLDEPSSLILKIHRNPRNYIYDSKKIIDSTTDDDPWGKKWISENIAGFGPYKMVSLNKGEKFIAVKHNDYWGNKPSINKLIMLQETSSSKRTQLLLNKEVEIAQFLNFEDIKNITNTPEINIDKVESSNMF